MIKEALQYIVGLSGINTFKHNEEWYSDRQLHRVPNEIDGPDPLCVNTLSGFMDYVAANEGHHEECTDAPLYIQIVSPTEVRLVSVLNADNKRSTYIKATALLPEQHFGRVLDQERFLIWLRTSFVETENRQDMIQFCGCVTGNDVVNLDDDGISQKVSVSTFVGTKDAIAPTDPILCPYRTFIDIEQPESQFVFRSQKLDLGVGFVLYEADGGAWKTVAMETIRKYILKYMEDHQEAFENREVIVIC
ncbi:MAG: hypothetical protein ACI4EE_10330 [Lachnospiraceae bacterium]